MEHTPRKGLWRIEFRTDLTRADATVIPLGFVHEAHFPTSIRWLGLLFRKRLTVSEADRIDLLTWPELRDDLEPFMRSLFDSAWSLARTASDNALGTPTVAAKYSHRSALHFAPLGEGPPVASRDPVKRCLELCTHLLALRGKLAPVISAPVVPLRRRKTLAPAATVRPDVELMNFAA
jgi:hypothetical protein